MATSVWGVDHGYSEEEIEKALGMTRFAAAGKLAGQAAKTGFASGGVKGAFKSNFKPATNMAKAGVREFGAGVKSGVSAMRGKLTPVTGPKPPSPGVQRGLSMVNSMPKPTAVPKAPRQQFGKSFNYKGFVPVLSPAAREIRSTSTAGKAAKARNMFGGPASQQYPAKAAAAGAASNRAAGAARFGQKQFDSAAVGGRTKANARAGFNHTQGGSVVPVGAGAAAHNAASALRAKSTNPLARHKKAIGAGVGATAVGAGGGYAVTKHFTAVSKSKPYEQRSSWNRPDVYNSRGQNTRNSAVGGALIGAATMAPAGLGGGAKAWGASAGAGAVGGAAIGAAAGHWGPHKNTPGAKEARTAMNSVRGIRDQYKADKHTVGRKQAKTNRNKSMETARRKYYRDLSKV